MPECLKINVMNRALKILSIAVILFLAYMWVSILYKSCNKNSEFEGFEEEFVEDSNEVPALSDDYEDEPFFKEDEGEEKATVSSDKTDPIDYNELDQKIEETQKETKRDVSQSNPVQEKQNAYTDSGDAGGRYMVIAGSYILESNADQMVKKLEGMGYSNPEKVVFDLSQFHAVCAGRYDDYTKAVQVSSELKRRGVDNYVHKRK